MTICNQRMGLPMWMVQAVILCAATCRHVSAVQHREHINLRLPHAHVHIHQTKALGGSDCTKAMNWELEEYRPSPWEKEWLDHGELFHQIGICTKMHEQSSLSIVWMDSVLKHQREGATKEHLRSLNPHVWSKYIYKNNCPTSPKHGEIMEVPIEPLIGNLRHPYYGPCKPDGVQEVGIEDRDYIMINPIPPEDFLNLYSGRKYLFDLGTNAYSTSISWMVERYGHHGIHFDEIWAWESAPVSGEEYWKDVPTHLKPKMHYYNTLIPADKNSLDNPANIIRSVFKPGDFVVVKLDIESHEPTESDFMAALLDEDVGAMVAEMFYELHFGDIFIPMGFKLEHMPGINRMHELRRSGLRVHYWP